MPLSISSYITTLNSQFSSASTYLATCSTQLRYAGTDLSAELFLNAGDHLYAAGNALETARGFLYNGTISGVCAALLLCLNKINTDWPTDSTVSMASILSAMLLATPDELTKFIGIEQAFMAAMWNAPYNGEYYAALARGFRKWP